ncbi:alpha beta-hydrolase [Coniophora puteana RWD-64-598 SS2]|uniref:Alpha beta-hydrolase n=1 Tax=Coniophora puteana (strain RWD-64-598) TaxID=741705 RepID=A0A5M3M8M1_CONPW|nr:alpha beta-hydrolase [Coniophora puteana RWD-64-598 SS2]EIW75397.1 alpha beta-hydrolase [Coniophora puteana RWD-64-598 SS2]
MASSFDISAKTVWGSPAAKKRALLIHGLTCAPSTMVRLAEVLVALGYQVTAPDLLGHGIGPRADKYLFEDICAMILPHLEETTYDLIIGHSLGGLVALALMSQLPPAYAERGTLRLVTVDAPLILTPKDHDKYTALFGASTKKTPSIDFYAGLFPLWRRADAAQKVLADELCAPTVSDELFAVRIDVIRSFPLPPSPYLMPETLSDMGECAQVNRPWNFRRFLDTVPSWVSFLAIAGDPDCGALFNVKELEMYPNIEKKTIPKATHWIPLEFPKEVINASVAY